MVSAVLMHSGWYRLHINAWCLFATSGPRFEKAVRAKPWVSILLGFMFPGFG